MKALSSPKELPAPCSGRQPRQGKCAVQSSGIRLPRQRARRTDGRLLVKIDATASKGRQPLESRTDSGSLQTLSALDALLGSTDDASRPSSTQTEVEGASFTLSRSAEALPSRSLPPTTSSTRAGSSSSSNGEPTSLVKSVSVLAKDFVVDKVKGALRRPTARDLIEEEDALALPQIKPRWSYLLLAVNLGVYFAGIVAGLGPDGKDASQDYFLALAKIDSAIESGEYHRLLTANFLHDSFAHLASSCYALATVAPAIEEVLGGGIFLAVYVLAGVGGSVGTFILGDAVTVGASSGIFGLIGALVIYLYKNKSLAKTNAQLQSIGTVMATNLLMGSIQETAVDNVGHLAGLLVGAYLGWGLSPQHLLASSASSKPATGSTGDGAAGEDGEEDIIDVMHVSHSKPLRRWAGYASFATTLALMVVGTVVTRTGVLPPIKGLDIFAF